ncbi:Ca-activated chloride channel family protein [Hymenobacter luteus]|uniref:Ca-activated chloride channel family protein n=2 Tax=Hymenobacter TaxID=89966 RepID=A0A7W9SZR8_9BACT|nr:VWA domain-containing protein [Hymenobacter latericoloratus]MBB4601443.1 Ca-activated chloride channel family protein [Hymenobacter latericoloratus]MBB6058350.1 Ca-activated chloride channel family protein [Hymenobacter luteus]
MLNWAYPLGWPEGLAAIIFFLLYLGYALRTRRLAAPLGQRGWALGWKLVLRVAYVGLLGAALLGPAYGITQRPVRTAGKDVWLLVDLSRSMDAVDVAPSRLQKVKQELTTLVNRFQADRLGLIVFGREAYVQCPLTYDQAALQLFLSTLQTSLVPAGSTDLAAPLELVLRRLERSPSAAAEALPRAVAIVLVTDGEDFGENLEPTTRILARSGTRVFPMGVGTAEGSRIPQAGGRGYVRDARGREAITRLVPAPLRRLAEQTGGQYFELTDRRNEFPLLLNALNRLEGQAEQVRTVSVADNRYRYPLVLALLLLLLDVVVTVKVIRP